MSISPLVNGIKYIITNKDDIIQRTVNNGEQWNANIVDVIKEYISQLKLRHFVNVGCHIGTVCLPISLCIEDVTAIEAYPDTYKHLCENIKVNNIKNIVTYNIAVGNSYEDIYFMSCDKICPIENVNRVINNTGGMAVFTESDIQYNIRSACLTDKKIKNKMSKFDNLKIDNFDIILIDIEGLEYEFLLGAKEKIIKNKPIIIIEIWSDYKRKRENMKTTQNEIIDLIISFGYKLKKQICDDFIFEPL